MTGPDVPLHILAWVAGIVHPWCFARAVFPRAGLKTNLAAAALFAIAASAAGMVTLHLAGIAITPPTVSLYQAALAVIAAGACLARRVRPRPAPDPTDAPFLLILLVFAVLVLPFTYLTGIDTYKWQDLATSVAVEQEIPWLVHPLSLWGFTPRSYPSLHPLFLATVQIGGGLGVDWGFYAVSLVQGILGAAAAFLLGRHVFDGQNRAGLNMAALYTFSPLFMRYNYWAAGRGLFLSVFALFLVCGLAPPRRRNLPAAAALAILVTLTHKTGWFALAAVAISLPFVPIARRALTRPWARRLLPLPFVALAILIAPAVRLPAPAGNLAGFLRFSATRFGIMLPAAALWFLMPGARRPASRLHAILPAALLTLPIAFDAEPYGALIALPFVTIVAMAGLERIAPVAPDRARLFRRIVCFVVVAAAGAMVVHRASGAVPRRVHAAAVFLDRYDREGPYRVIAPGHYPQRIQAYVRGCPRFTVTAYPETRLRFAPLPRPDSLPALLKACSRYARHAVYVAPLRAYLYGLNPRLYFVTVDGHGDRPPDARRLYLRDGVAVWAPASQPAPTAPPVARQAGAER